MEKKLYIRKKANKILISFGILKGIHILIEICDSCKDYHFIAEHYGRQRTSQEGENV